MSESISEHASNPWNNSGVKDALADGRNPNDIALIECPECGLYGYYNQGSHFTCSYCEHFYHCITEDEDSEQFEDSYLCIRLDEVITLADWDGFDPPDIP